MRNSKTTRGGQEGGRGGASRPERRTSKRKAKPGRRGGRWGHLLARRASSELEKEEGEPAAPRAPICHWSDDGGITTACHARRPTLTTGARVPGAVTCAKAACLQAAARALHDQAAPAPTWADRKLADHLKDPAFAGGYYRERAELDLTPGSNQTRAIADTARLWRGLSYDQMIAVAAGVRKKLGVGRPQTRRPLPNRLTRPELEQLLAHAYRTKGERGLFTKTLVLTGARVSEFVDLDVEDFTYDDQQIKIRHGKGDKARVVPVLPALADELRVYLAHRTTGPLFVSRTGRRFSPRRVQQILAELAAGAGLTKRVYPHLMRHTVAQHLLDGGMALEQVQRFLGHAHISTTQIYAESSPAAIRDNFRRALEKKDQ